MKHTKTNPLKTYLLVNVALLGLSALMPFDATYADEWHGHTSAVIGKKDLDNNDWGQHDLQGVIGMMIDFKQESWPVSIAIDLAGIGDKDDESGRKKETYSAVLQVGVRKIFRIENSPFKPYMGAGIMFINSEMRDTDNSTKLSKIEDDSATGTWFGVGSYVELSEHFQIGVDVKYSDAKVTLFNSERKAGGLQTVFSMGYHW